MGTRRYSAARDQRETLARVAAMLARRNPALNAAADAADLCRWSRSLSRIAERGCNEDRGCGHCLGDGWLIDHDAASERRDCPKCVGSGSLDGPREARLQAQVRAVAEEYGLRAYFQGDPRGAALYLIDPAKGPASEDDSHYSSRGVAAY